MSVVCGGVIGGCVSMWKREEAGRDEEGKNNFRKQRNCNLENIFSKKKRNSINREIGAKMLQTRTIRKNENLVNRKKNGI